MAYEIKIGGIYLDGFTGNAKAIDLGEDLEFNRFSKNLEKSKPIYMALFFSVFFIISTVVATSFSGNLMTGLIIGIILGGIAAWSVSKNSDATKKQMKAKIVFAKQMGGSYYQVGGRFFFYGKKGEYHILSEKPYIIGSISRGKNNRDNVYLNNLIITKYAKQEQNIRGNFIKIQTEKTKIELFGKKGIFHIGKVNEEKDVVLGNPKFDNKFVIISNNPNWAKKILDKEIQEKIQNFISWKIRITRTPKPLFGNSKGYDFILGIAEQGGIEMLLPSIQQMDITGLKELIDILYPITEKFEKQEF